MIKFDVLNRFTGGDKKSEASLFREGLALTHDDAHVSGNAFVFGDAQISNDARIYSDVLGNLGPL